MTDSVQSEERYPLLFLFLNDGNKGNKKNRGVFFERSRSQGIMSGATAVLTQWPGHLSSCGLMMIVLILTVLFFFLMLLATSIKPVPTMLHPRCMKKDFNGLLSTTNLFLINEDGPWQQNELDILEEVLTKYTQCDIELLILREGNSTQKGAEETNTTKNYDVQPKKVRRYVNRNRRYMMPKNITDTKFGKLDLNINIGAKKLLQAFMERRRHLNITSTTSTSSTTSIPELPTIHDILVKFPRVFVRNTTKREFFENSPLYGVWTNLNKRTLNFAARVLKLWENGGITFEIPHAAKFDYVSDYYKYDVVQDNSSTTPKVMNSTLPPLDSSKLVRNMIDMGYSSFQNLPEGLVTVDEEGVHMETKTTCHAFFGEALVQLKQATNKTTVPEVIRNTLKTFCVRGAVDSEYCNSIRPK